jgi:hypothetical protein
MTGERVPEKVDRDRLATAYEIPVEWWDEEPEKSSSPTASQQTEEAPSGPLPSGSAFDLARSLQQDIQEQFNKMRDEKAAYAPAERAQVSVRLASAIRTLSNVTGETQLERRFYELAPWKDVERELYNALRDYPDAAAAVASRFAALKR